MTRFEVGKKYVTNHNPNIFTCIAVFDDVPVLKGGQEGSKPWTPFFPEYYKEYVEPKPPIIVERWVNVYQRTTDGSIRTSEPYHSEHAAKQAARFTRVSKLIGTIHFKEQFDAV